ncbi:MAG: endonuclease/exonuclease/phosphatase family protein, partial [Bacteroidota bacterium]
YPYTYQPKRKRLAIYSKYPLTQKGNMDMGNTANGCAFADIKINQQFIRVYNVHLQSNGVTKDAGKLQKEGDLQKKETWQGIKGILSKVKKSGVIRSEQAQTIVEHLQKSKYPVIVGGDFNDTPLSHTYQLFSRVLKDGFKERAVGIGTTFNGTIPLLRIDYLWTDKKFKVNSHQIVRENFSDHYPVISRIQL